MMGAGTAQGPPPKFPVEKGGKGVETGQKDEFFTPEKAGKGRKSADVMSRVFLFPVPGLQGRTTDHGPGDYGPRTAGLRTQGKGSF